MQQLEKQIVATKQTNPIVTFNVSVELQQRITLVFNPNAKELKNKLAVTLSAMTDVFEKFERMDDILRRKLIQVVEAKIKKDEEIKANKKR